MTPFSDATLILRVHAEHQWLSEELGGLLDQLENPASLQADELQAAIAYLEVSWAEERRRARQTDGAYARLECHSDGASGHGLLRQACSYYRWLRGLRATLAERVEPFLGDERAALRLR